MALDPASLPDDVAALKRLIVGMAREAVHASTLIEKLRGELARLRRARFGASSEKLGGRVEQLELAIEALDVDEAERLAATPAAAGALPRGPITPALAVAAFVVADAALAAALARDDWGDALGIAPVLILLANAYAATG